jgi:hypothetical protein
MPITLPSPPAPTSIPSIKVTLYHSLPTESDPARQGVNYQLSVLDQNGARFRFPQDQGSALPHITQEDIDYFQDFIIRFRAYAEGQVLE